MGKTTHLAGRAGQVNRIFHEVRKKLVYICLAHYFSRARREFETGVPNPTKYNQHYVNTYSLPKAFSSHKKPEKLRRKIETESVLEVENAYDQQRRGFMGWKLCKVPTQDANDSKFGLDGSGIASINGRRPHTSHAPGAGTQSPKTQTPRTAGLVGNHNESTNFSLHPARITFAGDDFVRRNMQMIKEATKSMNSASLSGSLHRGSGRSQTAMVNERRKIVLQTRAAQREQQREAVHREWMQLRGMLSTDQH